MEAGQLLGTAAALPGQGSREVGGPHEHGGMRPSGELAAWHTVRLS